MKSQCNIKSRAVVGSAIAALLIAGGAFGGRAWAIVGGEPDGNRHPCVGAVLAQMPGYGVVPFASCTLVHPRVAITTGHAAFFGWYEIYPFLGVSFDQEIDLANPTFIPIMWMWAYPMFTGTANPYQLDIALLVFAEPVTGITPAKLPYEGFLDDLKAAGVLHGDGPEPTRFTVVGYGWDLEFPPTEPIIDPDKAVRKIAQPRYLGMNDGWLFAHQNLASGDSGAAKGDSGGATLWTDPVTGEQTLVSITAWGCPKFVGNVMSFRIDEYWPLFLINWATNRFPVP